MELKFEGKTVLVTGAGQGIGRALCLKLANCGAKVLALSRTKSHLVQLANENANIQPINVDLADWSATRKALESIGKVDCLVNNAAIAKDASLFEVTEDDIDRLFNVNVKAVINVTQMIAKGMVERKQGSIVNVSSQAALRGVNEHTVYCGTKGALDGMTRVWALELGRHNVRVNSINPTVVLTAMGQGWNDPAKGGPMKARIPLDRFAEVDEVVDAIIFLLSDNSAMINGVALPIDGGFCST